jgi:uncharacterized protein YgiB involved in biofilm formation
MIVTPSRGFIIAAALVVAAFAAFVMTRRTPACGGKGQIMSTISECKSWGFGASTCEAVVGKARAIAQRATPGLDNSVKCETQFTDCFKSDDGAYHPIPSFCLQQGATTAAEPTDLHYLEYESDRMNRKKTHEVPIK